MYGALGKERLFKAVWVLHAGSMQYHGFLYALSRRIST
jgi:hypothetical protein